MLALGGRAAGTTKWARARGRYGRAAIAANAGARGPHADKCADSAAAAADDRPRQRGGGVVWRAADADFAADFAARGFDESAVTRPTSGRHLWKPSRHRR